MLPNLYRNGVTKAGFIPMTHEVGFSGIADITWADAARMTNGKLPGGARCEDTLHRSKRIVCAVTLVAEESKDRL